MQKVIQPEPLPDHPAGYDPSKKTLGKPGWGENLWRRDTQCLKSKSGSLYICSHSIDKRLSSHDLKKGWEIDLSREVVCSYYGEKRVGLVDR